MRVWSVSCLAGLAAVCLIVPSAYAPPVPVEVPISHLSTAVFSPDNKHVFVSYTGWPVDFFGGSHAAMLDVASGKALHGHDDASAPVAFLPDGKRYVIVACHRERVSTLTVRDVRTGKVARTFAERPERVRALAVSPDGKLALTGHDDGSILSWDLATGKLSGDFDVKDRKADSVHTVYSIFFSPDGKRAYSNDQRSITAWDVATGKQVAPDFEAYQKANGWSHIAFSPSADGRLVCSGCHLFDREQPLVRVWDLKTGRMVGSFRGHRDCYVGGAALTPDGKRAFSAPNWGEDVLREWDVPTGKQVWKMKLGESYRAVAFSADARLALIGDDDGRLRLLDLRTKKVLWTLRPRR